MTHRNTLVLNLITTGHFSLFWLVTFLTVPHLLLSKCKISSILSILKFHEMNIFNSIRKSCDSCLVLFKYYIMAFDGGQKLYLLFLYTFMYICALLCVECDYSCKYICKWNTGLQKLSSFTAFTLSFVTGSLTALEAYRFIKMLDLLAVRIDYL